MDEDAELDLVATKNFQPFSRAGSVGLKFWQLSSRLLQLNVEGKVEQFVGTITWSAQERNRKCWF